MPIATSDRSPLSRLRAHQQEYLEYLPLTERVQADLKEDVDTLRAQEGWDVGTSRGVDDWVDDTGAMWRALRRHRYDPDKALAGLLSTLTHRLSRSLHAAPPSSNPYSTSALFHILPLPNFATRKGQPVVLITLREVRRDAQGGLGEMKEWTWWALEMVRRVLKGWWVVGAFPDGHEPHRDLKRSVEGRGYGGEGCVLVIDAEGAGYRNLEVELLPTLLSVGHNHFPGVFDSVHVVNAGWTHRSMWTVVKRILPKSALEKVNFLDTKEALESVFYLDRLPQCYGGSDTWTFSPENNPMFEYCSKPSANSSTLIVPTPTLPTISPPAPALPLPSSRSASTTSLADVYYTAQNTPASSRPSTRPSSRRGSLSGLTGTNALNDLRMTSTALHRARSTGNSERGDGVSAKEGQRRPYARRPSTVRPVSPGMSPLQRIKSLSDFHLYLSPSRLANLDLLSDSDSEASTPRAGNKRPLLPAVVDPEATISRAKSIADRRTRPPLRLLGVAAGGDEAGESVRSYSDQLSLHHAHILRGYQRSPTTLAGDTRQADAAAGKGQGYEAPDVAALADAGNRPGEDYPSEVHRVSAYSRTSNPWFGYPALRLSTSGVVPLYPRNRKRDLVKTLLFLFMLRLQSFRDRAERWLGLHHLGAIPWSRRGSISSEKTGPDEGLKRQAMAKRDKGVMGGWRAKGEWVWMFICLVLFRGGWSRVLGWIPLDALGMGGVRDVLGLG
ncbi:uncharacterized protein MKK02DRAFT_18520 [Dioszegia hungarica]|uniref:CRAL-TRIO domain-containing protein n=1 Tax=Dioszegia hungarica TaxID=4972 RepID=A0AA38H588_9TREE|nr:uncharacterized protein MKK02DRAFT_18520 [Dioszegia hungarica]KAI9633146.1 hypothetical protein MKK02DRAFT_18520 [Dioszegia hungarica]